MKFYLPLVLAGASLLAGCKSLNNEMSEKAEENDRQIQSYITANNLTPTKTPEGIYYQINNAIPTGRQPQVGEQLRFNFTLSNLSNQVVDSTYKTRVAKLTWGLNTGYDGGALLRGLSFVKEGESAIVLSPHTYGFGNQPAKDTNSREVLPAYSAIRYDLKLVDILSEREVIQEYVTEKKLAVTETTSSGLTYIRLKEGTGATITTGKNVTVKYTGMLLSGSKFDESSAAGVSWTVGVSSLISGFTEGLQKMKLGERAILILPYAIAYGTQGATNGSSYVVPPYTPILFEVEILSVN